MSEPDGVISLGQRFENIEAILRSIDGKLDMKVDYEVHATLVRRVEMLESGDTPLGRVMLGQFSNLQDQVNDLVTHGSHNAQDATAQIKDVEKNVENLRLEGAAARAITTNRTDAATRTLRIWALVISIVVAAESIIAITNSIKLH